MQAILAEDRIGMLIGRFKILYLVVSCFGFLSFVGLFLGFGDKPLMENKETIISFLIYATTYFGLKSRKPWVVDFILIISAFGILRTLLSLSDYPADLYGLVQRVFTFFWGLIFAYQIFYFSRKEVKMFFNDKGSTLFC
jgi:hypothetical protein